MNIMLYCLGGIAAVVLCLVFIRIMRLLLAERKKVLRRDRADEWLVEQFERCNVMVFGKQRSGKDLIFSHVIALIGRRHYSNIPYDNRTEIIDLAEINLGDNTFEDCVNGTIEKILPRFEEGAHIYISDGGIYLSNDFNDKLNKLYPSMPMFLALSAQIYGLHVHINSQAVGRPWKKVRDQADCYIQALGTVRRGDCLYTDIAAYDKINLAEAERDPFMRCTVRIPISEIKYDTRYFRKIFLDYSPSVRESAFDHIGEITHIGGIDHVA